MTVAKLNGADDAEIMNQTKHKSSAMIRRYTRLDNVRQHNAKKKAAAPLLVLTFLKLCLNGVGSQATL